MSHLNSFLQEYQTLLPRADLKAAVPNKAQKLTAYKQSGAELGQPYAHDDNCLSSSGPALQWRSGFSFLDSTLHSTSVQILKGQMPLGQPCTSSELHLYMSCLISLLWRQAEVGGLGVLGTADVWSSGSGDCMWWIVLVPAMGSATAPLV